MELPSVPCDVHGLWYSTKVVVEVCCLLCDICQVSFQLCDHALLLIKSLIGQVLPDISCLNFYLELSASGLKLFALIF